MPLQCNEKIPHIMKYMGSKRNIMEFVVGAINDAYKGGAVCDLFSGSAVLAAALRGQVHMVCNDIQAYSSVLARTYLASFEWVNYPNILDEIVEEATEYVEKFKNYYSDIAFDYKPDLNLKGFHRIEKAQRELLNKDFSHFPFHLYVKNYSGTYWSYEQCIWIDAIRGVAEKYQRNPIFDAILSSLMFAMSYCSQSTGHYAQYRDASSKSSMEDILGYRNRQIIPLFIKKFMELQEIFQANNMQVQVLTMDYIDCLDKHIDDTTTVYADPPYCFVHYSRFYHAVETLVRYDYPEVLYKGRYRTDRHQSPFCIRTKVETAFLGMFYRVRDARANLVLSYSDTGMIDLEKLVQLANVAFGPNYQIEVRTMDYLHSTMGRNEDKSRNVQECVIIAKEK